MMGADDLAAIRAHYGQHPEIFRVENALLRHIDAQAARLAALETAGDALDEALRVYVHGSGPATEPSDPHRRLIAWRRVAECRAAWRAARKEVSDVARE